jgi:hypothetical protein
MSITAASTMLAVLMNINPFQISISAAALRGEIVDMHSGVFFV